ncbi:MAG: phage tail protein [Roseburia sp.]|nr:phage tail protein [Roseburia sp.]MBQ8279540.1 phage tail protein [Roseburia sp.]
MYQVYCDSSLLFNDQVEGYDIFHPKVELELNQIGSFDFTIFNNHPNFDRLQRLKSIVTVLQDDFLLFRGRILDDIQGFHNEKQVFCEGELAFLVDSIQRPYDFTGTPAELFTQFITSHNAQVDAEHQFIVGNITVNDPNDYISRSDSEYLNTWESIQSKLLETLGGYIWIRHEADGVYIDYLAELNFLSPQKIEFGKNLLDLKRETKGADIATAIIPLGAKEEGGENRLTISSVNNGADYVFNQEAVDRFGWIFRVHEWDDVTEPGNLLTKGNAFLQEQMQMLYSIELDAADLATVDRTVESFHLGTKVQVTTMPHSIDQLFLVTKMSIELLQPASNKLTLGDTIQTFTERSISGQIRTENKLVGISSDLEEKLISGLNETETKLSAQITATSESITSAVMEEVYLKEDTDALISAVSTQVTQTAEDIEFRFTEFSQDIDAVAAGTDAQFEEISKYIRFVDGNIILGEEGNTLTLRIENDRIAFLDSGMEVAYFSNNKLYVTDAEILHSLQIGNFVYMPRNNGNVSFLKNR